MKKDFFLWPLAPGKRMCYNSHSTYSWVLPWHNAEAPSVRLHGVPPTTDVANTFMTTPIFYSLAFTGVFDDVFDDVISRNLRQWPQNYLYWKPLPLFDIWWKFEVTWASDAPSGLPYICKGSKNFFMGNWIELVILAVMSQYAVLISYFLWKKKLFYFFFLSLLDWQR